jgi:hypothetical protein
MTIPRLHGASILGLGLALGLLPAGCGSESAPIRDAAASRDSALADAPAVRDALDAITVGGPLPPRSDAPLSPFTTDAPYVIANPSCCTVELSVPDPTGDEVTARVLGDQAPLDRGVALTWSDGQWSASVCLPLDTMLKYRFYFGRKPIDYGVSDDDGGAGDDAGASTALPSTPDDAATAMEDDHRWNAEAPTAVDSSGDTWNVFVPIQTCCAFRPS